MSCLVAFEGTPKETNFVRKSTKSAYFHGLLSTLNNNCHVQNYGEKREQLPCLSVFDIRHSQVTNLCASATRVFTTLAGGSLETYHCYHGFCFHDIHGHFRTMGTMGTMRTLAGLRNSRNISSRSAFGSCSPCCRFASSCLDDNIHRSIPTSCCFTKQNCR